MDELIESAVFPILIAANSDAIPRHLKATDDYVSEVEKELDTLWMKLKGSGLATKIKLFLIYVPLGCKDSLSKAFDDRLKGLQIRSDM